MTTSRFGTMFVDDPVAAFGSAGRALRPDGRLAMLVRQARERNEWIVACASPSTTACGSTPGPGPSPPAGLDGR